MKTHRKVSGLSGNEIYCLNKAGFAPGQLCVGNSVIALGIGGGIGAGFRALSRGEVPQYSQIFDHTRHLALERVVNNAKMFGANSVVGIRTSISPVLGAQEMMMVGTASKHPLLNGYANEP